MILEFNAPGWRAQLASIMIQIDGYVADSAHHAIVGFDYRRQLMPGPVILTSSLRNTGRLDGMWVYE